MTRHKNRKYRCDVDRKYHNDVNTRTDINKHCKGTRWHRQQTDDGFDEDYFVGEKLDEDDDDDDIPTFDGSEFCGDK